MAGLSGYATSDPIEVRGSPVDIRLGDGEQTTVPDGVAWIVTLHPGNNTTSVCSIRYTPPGMDPTYDAENLTASSADKGFSNGSPETVLHAGGVISVSSNGDPGHLFGWEVQL